MATKSTSKTSTPSSSTKSVASQLASIKSKALAIQKQIPTATSSGSSKTSSSPNTTQPLTGASLVNANYQKALTEANALNGKSIPVTSLSQTQSKVNLPTPTQTTAQMPDLSGLTNPDAGLLMDEKGKFSFKPNIQGDPNSPENNLARLQSQLVDLMRPPESTADMYANTYGVNQRQIQRDYQTARKDVSAYTSQLNQIVAKREADLLRVEGQGRGIPEVIIGGQQAQINKEAAIAALPVAAQLAAAQGNLEEASKHVSALFQAHASDAKAQYDYQNRVVDSFYQYSTAREQRRLDEVKLEKQREYEDKKFNIQMANEWAMKAIEYGQSSLAGQIMKLDPTSKEFQASLAGLQGRVVKPVEGGVGFGGYSANQMKAITKLNEDISKNSTYAKTASMRNFVDNVTAALQQSNGVSDIAAINQFQKIIDEGAVTRDQDVTLLRSAQSLSDNLKTRIAGLERGDKLSETQRTQMRTLAESLYQAQVNALQKDPYIAAKTTEAGLYGLSLNDTIIGQIGTIGGVKEDSKQSDYSKEIGGLEFVKPESSDPSATAQGVGVFSKVGSFLGKLFGI